MSAYRDRLSGKERARYDAAITSAATAFAAACRDRDSLAAAEGPAAVARNAHYPGHPLTAEQIEQRYTALREQGQRQKAA